MSEIYTEYMDFMKIKLHEFICYESFIKLWGACFSYVKIRQFKAVTGKCDTCANLSLKRRTFHDSNAREQITMMHALHRSMYMGERLCYYISRHEALNFPSTVWSCISDVMAQMHNVLPYFGNMTSFANPLPQYLQGV